MGHCLRIHQRNSNFTKDHTIKRIRKLTMAKDLALRITKVAVFIRKIDFRFNPRVKIKFVFGKLAINFIRKISRCCCKL